MKKLVLSVVSSVCLLGAAHAETVKVTEKMVRNAVQGWCDALVKISSTAREGGDAAAVAAEVLSTGYDYDDGKVLFKPTLTSGKQTFRLTKEGALAYFVGGNPKYPDDTGFALKDWRKVRFDTAGVIVDDNIGIFMGNVFFTDGAGKETKVDKTFVFRFDEDGNARIITHKSALPYEPAKS
ncbi:MAG: hypothetical protein SFU53_04450 [Terrimicrobiaceae bacterium]|nr:hypothetical protein [Terrimicrobiaceae bacterium]